MWSFSEIYHNMNSMWGLLSSCRAWLKPRSRALSNPSTCPTSRRSLSRIGSTFRWADSTASARLPCKRSEKKLQRQVIGKINVRDFRSERSLLQCKPQPTRGQQLMCFLFLSHFGHITEYLVAKIPVVGKVRVRGALWCSARW